MNPYENSVVPLGSPEPQMQRGQRDLRVRRLQLQPAEVRQGVRVRLRRDGPFPRSQGMLQVNTLLLLSKYFEKLFFLVTCSPKNDFF